MRTFELGTSDRSEGLDLKESIYTGTDLNGRTGQQEIVYMAGLKELV